MSQPDRIEFITELVTPLAASLGLAVWGVELGGAARPIARIYVDVLPGAEPAPSEKASDDDLLPQGVTIDQCAELSRLAGLALDVEDPFATNWTLEISSPGLQRPFFKIDQLRNYVGRELEVVLAAPLDTWPGRKKFSGVLAAVADGDPLDTDVSFTLRSQRKVKPEGAKRPVMTDVDETLAAADCKYVRPEIKF